MNKSLSHNWDSLMQWTTSLHVPWKPHTRNHRCNSLAELDDEVFKACLEHITSISKSSAYGMTISGNYIRFVPESFQQVAPVEMYRAKEKLLYRFISEVPVFTYDDQQTLSLNSCNIVIPDIDGLEMKYILAILNSSVAAYFISKKFNSVKLLRLHIEQMPIPVVSIDVQASIIKK